MAKHNKKNTKKKKKSKLSPEEKKKRRLKKKYKVDIKTIFTNCGFTQVTTRGVNINVNGRIGEIDSIFFYENIIIICEDTFEKANLSDHLRKKIEFFQFLKNNLDDFHIEIRRKYPKFRSYFGINSKYKFSECKLIFLYCSKADIRNEYKTRYRNDCKFLDYAHLQYFLNLSKTIQRSARFELFKFLGLELNDIGPYSSASLSSSYDGLLLPEIPSGFPQDHKLVSFLVDPNMLLTQSYVLRADSWNDSECLYQRLLLKSKIKSMREYLADKKRVYINNIITTLPSETELKDNNGNLIIRSDANIIKTVKITIPKKFGTIGIIDGQHRLYSYHEGKDTYDKKIENFRKKQHLLVTGIIYPQDMTPAKKQQFEAELFLEINDKQKRVKGDLKQAIERIINPYSPIAIAKAVITALAYEGPLEGQLEIHFYDIGKIKTTSIVSYGLKHIVGIPGEQREQHSLFKEWKGKGKGNIKRNKQVLDGYIRYCAKQINMLVSGFKESLREDLWTSDKRISRVLTTTTINGLIYCLRLLIEHKKLNDFEYYKKVFKELKIDFRPDKFPYKSSHWKALGEEIYKQCFDKENM